MIDRIGSNVHSGCGWLEPVKSVLPRFASDLAVSKRKLRQAEGITLVRTRRDEQKQSLAFSSRPFVLCGLPVRQPPKGQLLFERRNGRFLLQITGHPQYGLPFGQDRLVPIYLATLAVQQKSPTVRFRSGAEMLETFGLQKGGKEYRRLVSAFERIFGATIFFGTDTLNGKAKLVERSRFHFLREARIWYHRRPEQTVLSAEFENVIVLSDEFYQEISAHPIPTDLEAVKVLAGAPAVLDLFLWLSYRCFLATTEEAIPLFGPFGLAQQLGSGEYSRPRRFRAKLQQWLDTIRALWPECPARLTPDGQSLLVSPGTAFCRTPKGGSMNQHLSPPSHFSRRSGSLLRSAGHPVAARRFTLQVRLRGETAPTCEIRCVGLEDALQLGEAHFLAFAERNPWIGLDSLQRKIWILLDPETDSTR